MSLTIRSSFAACLLALLALPHDAHAQTVPQMVGRLPADVPAKRVLSSASVVRKGLLTAHLSRRVRLGAGSPRTISTIANSVFARHRQLSNDLSRNTRGLLGAPRSVEYFAETGDTVVLIKNTAFTVTDAAVVAQRAPGFRKMRRRRRPAGALGIDSKTRLEFERWKRTLATKPAGHPLRQAAARGERALLRAIADGKGDFEVTTSVVVPKNDLAITGGTVSRPSWGARGFATGRTRRERLRFKGSSTTAARLLPWTPPKVGGTTTTKIPLVAGFTWGDRYTYSSTWRFTSGYASITASAWWGLGLRIPMELTTQVSPSLVKHVGRDNRRHYTVDLRARTLDAGPDFYRRAGIDDEKIFAGKELVTEAGFKVSYAYRVGWGASKGSGSFGGKKAPFSRHFTPPTAGCTSCGIDAWIPAATTQTEFNVGVLSGNMRVGFKLGGTGTVGVRYESKTSRGRLASRTGRRAAMAHDLQLVPNETVRLTSTLGLGTYKYGFIISKPSYTWHLSLIPGVRGKVNVGWRWLSYSFDIQPIWFDALGLDIGSVTFPRHRGTPRAHHVWGGEKSFCPVQGCR